MAIIGNIPYFQTNPAGYGIFHYLYQKKNTYRFLQLNSLFFWLFQSNSFFPGFSSAWFLWKIHIPGWGLFRSSCFNPLIFSSYVSGLFWGIKSHGSRKSHGKSQLTSTNLFLWILPYEKIHVIPRCPPRPNPSSSSTVPSSGSSFASSVTGSSSWWPGSGTESAPHSSDVCCFMNPTN